MTNMTKDEIKALQIKAAEICEFLELRAGSYIIPKPEFYFPRLGSEVGFDIAEIAKQFKERFAGFFQEG